MREAYTTRRVREVSKCIAPPQEKRGRDIKPISIKVVSFDDQPPPKLPRANRQMPSRDCPDERASEPGQYQARNRVNEYIGVGERERYVCVGVMRSLDFVA